MAATTTRLPSGCCIPGLVPTAADRRAQRGEAAIHRRKSGVGCHSLSRFATHLKRSLPTKVASAVVVGCGFRRKESGFTSNSRACRRQLRLWCLRAVKLLLVTGKRGRRRQDMGWGPLGPVQSVANLHTEQAVSRRGQPVIQNILAIVHYIAQINKIRNRPTSIRRRSDLQTHRCDRTNLLSALPYSAATSLPFRLTPLITPMGLLHSHHSPAACNWPGDCMFCVRARVRDPQRDRAHH